VALGAGTRDVVGLVGGRALVLIGAGLSAGLAGALVLARLLQSQLWGVTPTDPATYAAAILLLVLVALIACAFPLRRATGVDPTTALRCE
jgi:ABC-type antimicrobial peptide transport system permease subunit